MSIHYTLWETQYSVACRYSVLAMRCLISLLVNNKIGRKDKEVKGWNNERLFTGQHETWKQN